MTALWKFGRSITRNSLSDPDQWLQSNDLLSWLQPLPALMGPTRTPTDSVDTGTQADRQALSSAMTSGGFARPANADSAAATTPTTTQTTAQTAVAASPFIINIIWDSSIANAPVGFTDGVLRAVHYLESQYSDAVTININVGYGVIHGTAMSSGSLGQSNYYLSRYSYSTLRNALVADRTTTTDTAVLAELTSTDPTGGGVCGSHGRRRRRSA